ncbi:hypothetical protein M0638_28505, partial [Roseomonas sp. NAR14]
TAGPDAALLALCADLQVAVAECNAASHLCDVMLEAGDDAGSKRAWEAMDAASDRANRLLERITPVTPRTMPGLLAKAHAVRAIGPHFGTDSHRNIFEAAGDAIVADILRLGGVA